MNSVEKFKMRQEIVAEPSKNLEVMLNNKITDDWTKGAILQELLFRKIVTIDKEIKTSKTH